MDSPRMTIGGGIEITTGPLAGAIVYPCTRDAHCHEKNCCYSRDENCLCDHCFPLYSEEKQIRLMKG